MKVVKKDGRLQELDTSKIKGSLMSASSSNKSLLNESDANIIVEDVVKKLKSFRGEEYNTSSYEIIGVVLDILKRDGFDDLISSYIGYEKE